MAPTSVTRPFLHPLLLLHQFGRVTKSLSASSTNFSSISSFRITSIRHQSSSGHQARLKMSLVNNNNSNNNNHHQTKLNDQTTPTNEDRTQKEIARIRSEFIDRFSDGNGRLELRQNHTTGVAYLCIRNPAKKNCLNGEMMARLGDIVDELEQWQEGKALVIYGEQRFFCSGGDLDTVRNIANRSGGQAMQRLMQHNLDRLARLPLISVAYVEGMALGGGAELMTACDYRLAAPAATIGFVQVKVGITTVWGGAARLVPILGYGRALHLVATGRTVTGAEAREMGFVDGLLPEKKESASGEFEFKFDAEHSEVERNATEFLRPFLAVPREILGPAKLVTVEAREPTVDGYRAEERHGLSVWGGPGHQRALNGKVNHRRPVQ